MPTLDIQLPVLEHKWIKLYNSEEEQQADILNYTECCYWVIKNPDAGPDNEATYQYSIRTTNNDNEKLGHYYTVETADQWSGLEIIWGYFGWEWNEYTWNEQILQGGNLFLKITTQNVRTIPDGYRLQHINYFLGSQDSVTSIESFDNSNIISAMNLNGYRPTDTVRNLTLAISDWNNVENARGMFENIQLTIANNTLNLPKATDCSYIFNSVAGTTITFNWNFPLAENLSYAFYNVNGDIAPYDNNQFVQDHVTNIDYCFGADNLKRINTNISQIPTATTAKGLFRARIINNSSNNIALPICEYLDYALEECDLSQVGRINFTSNVLKSAKGLIKNSTINNTADTFLNSLQYLTNFNLVEDFSEYLMDMNHDSTNNSITFDISGQTGEHSNVTLVDFCSNANINLKFIGNNKCIYDDFCQGGTLTIDTNSVFTGGQSYNNMFLGTTFNSTNLPVNTFEAGKEYNNLYNECTFNQPVNIDFGTTINRSKDILTDSVFNNSSTFSNFSNLEQAVLDFGFITEQDTFNFTLSNNTTDFELEEGYSGFKIFRIGKQFNCKQLSTQQIKVIHDFEVEVDHLGGVYVTTLDLIDNNYVTDLSNITLTIAGYNGSTNSNHNIMYVTSQSMTNTPVFVTDRTNTDSPHIYSLHIQNCPKLQELNGENEYFNSRARIDLDQDEMIYFRTTICSAFVTLTSSKLDIPTLTQSINANTAVYQSFELLQSTWDQLDEDTQAHFIEHSREISLIQDT